MPGVEGKPGAESGKAPASQVIRGRPTERVEIVCAPRFPPVPLGKAAGGTARMTGAGGGLARAMSRAFRRRRRAQREVLLIRHLSRKPPSAAASRFAGFSCCLQSFGIGGVSRASAYPGVFARLHAGALLVLVVRFAPDIDDEGRIRHRASERERRRLRERRKAYRRG